MWVHGGMTRFADPGRCPDCRATLTPGSFECPSCRLDLSGERGQRLFTLLSQADQLLVEMRARTAARATVPAGAPAPVGSRLPSPVSPTAPVPVGAGSPPSYAGTGGPGGPGPFPAPAGQAPRPAVSGSAVPRILLGLGSLTVLVAISLFFLVAWDALGPGGRTAVLMLLTGVAGTVTVGVAQRDLRAAAEALGAVTFGLLAGVVVGARSAGWLATTNDAQLSLMLGSVLVVAGLGSALALTHTRAGRLVTAEVTAAIGGLVLVGGIAGSDWSSPAGRLVVAVPLVAVITVLARFLGQLIPDPPDDEDVVAAPAAGPAPVVRRLLPLQAATIGLGAVTLLTWVALLVAGLERVTRDLTLADVWGGGGLPLLAAGVYAVVPALLPVPRPARLTALSLAVLSWTLLLTAPAWDEGATTLAAVMAATTLVLAVVLATGPLPWVRAAGAGLVVTVPVLLVQSLQLLGEGLATFGRAASQEWRGTPGGRLDPHLDGLPAAWVLPATLLVGVVTGFAVWRAVRGSHPDREHVSRVAEVAVVSALLGGLLVTTVPVAVLLAAILLVAARVGTQGLRGHRRMSPEAAGGTVLALGLAALALSAYDEWLTLLACLALGALAVDHHRHEGTVRWAGWVGGFALAPLGAGALWSVAALADLPGEWAALVVLLALGAWVVIRGLLEEPVEPEAAAAPSARTWGDRVLGVELGTVAAACLTALVGTDSVVPAVHAPSWVAVYLTVMGVVATVVALTRDERRRPAGWLGGVLLAAATWVRLADLGVQQPEPYTLPSAVALLVVGWFHLRRHAEASTLGAWSSGLALALVPSLLWVLADPVSLRALLLGVACLALVLTGSRMRWAAPFVWGSAVGTVLVLRMVAPVALLVGPFLLFALGGIVLLVVGATWERRMQDADRLRRYVDGLR